MLVRNILKVIVFIIVVIVGAYLYNIYLVDHSSINLKAALIKASNAKTREDMLEIKKIVRFPLFKELEKTDLPKKNFMLMEIVENSLVSSEGMDRSDNIRACLEAIVANEEKKKPELTRLIDKFNSILYKPVIDTPRKKLEARAKNILNDISVTTDPESRQILYYELCNVYVQLDNVAEAERAFWKGFDKDEKNPLALRTKFNIAWAYKEKGEYDKAMTYFDELKECCAGKEMDAISRHESADILYRKGDYTEARDAYALLASQYPKYDTVGIAFMQAGYISFYNLNDSDSALKYFSELEYKYPEIEFANNIVRTTKKSISDELREEGYDFLIKGQYAEAEDRFKKAILISPSDGSSISGLSLAFFWTDNRQEAIEFANRAVVLFNNEIAITNSMYIYIKTGRLEDSINVAEEAKRTIKINISEFYYNLGCAYLSKGEINDAIENFRISVKLKDDFAPAYNNLGCALWAAGQYSESTVNFKKAAAIDTDYMDAYYNLGLAYFLMNRLEESAIEFKKVLLINEAGPKDAKTDEGAKYYMSQISNRLHYQP